MAYRRTSALPHPRSTRSIRSACCLGPAKAHRLLRYLDADADCALFVVLPLRADEEGRARKFKIKGTAGRLRRHARGRRRAISAHAAHGGPFPDLVVIDGGKGQLLGGLRGLRQVGLERLVAIGLAKKRNWSFTRDRLEGRVARESRLCAAADSRRGPPVRGHSPQSRAARTRAGSNRWKGRAATQAQLLTAFGSVAGVRRASRTELADVVGPKAADAVLRHFTT
jgi:hypothetical protein